MFMTYAVTATLPARDIPTPHASFSLQSEVSTSIRVFVYSQLPRLICTGISILPFAARFRTHVVP
jgi:hypothetical protein